MVRHTGTGFPADAHAESNCTGKEMPEINWQEADPLEHA